MSAIVGSTSSDSAKTAALEALAEASAVASFVQIITDLSRGDGIDLSSEQTIGFYYSMQHVIDRISLAEGLVNQLEKRKQHG